MSSRERSAIAPCEQYDAMCAYRTALQVLEQAVLTEYRQKLFLIQKITHHTWQWLKFFLSKLNVFNHKLINKMHYHSFCSTDTVTDI